ncbi:M56 family metallopeptidase [Algoriphagus sp. CAU 1675]|uniref:M56 family metallopeptidase n=1 Tax=Algoriphagus sp. CAU 1675 TaxID=3032597 RepID=UPI0023D9CC83|nr:M56 family metallopeptidase [Algoriphagus sp. CAU 1675]MDF2158228.1 M56 family metallopeptidase [Algoriphagus sp. CAU 1675]
MNSILNYLLEGSIILACSWCFYKLVLDQLTFFDWNRAVLLGSLGLALLLPLMSFELAPQSATLAEFSLPTINVGEQVAMQESVYSWQNIFISVYGLGFLLTIGRIVLGLAKPIFQLQLVEKYQYKGMNLAVHPSFEPASFFNYILLPKFDPEDPDQRQILLHESVHVSKRHTWDLILLQLVKAIFWFNPWIYSLEKSLREVHEYQADQGVTQSFSQIDYSRLLLRLITQDQGWQFTNSFNQFQTKKRIVMMNKTQSDSMQKSRFLLLLPLVGIMFLVFACDQSIGEEPIKPENVVEVLKKDGSSELVGMVNGKVVEIDADEVFDVVEEQPQPPGGMSGWNQFLATNLQYPAKAREMGVEGTVIVVFEIGTDGLISNPEILRGIGAGCDEEALRVISMSPKWEPGKQRGREVRTRMRLPIRFKLS